MGLWRTRVHKNHRDRGRYRNWRGGAIGGCDTDSDERLSEQGF